MRKVIFDPVVTISRSAVTAEAAGSSPVVPTIFFQWFVKKEWSLPVVLYRNQSF